MCARERGEISAEEWVVVYQKWEECPRVSRSARKKETELVQRKVEFVQEGG